MRRSIEIHLRRFWRTQRWPLAAGVAVLAVVGVVVLSTRGPAESPQLPPRSQVCAAARQAVAEISSQSPAPSRADLEQLKRDLCTREPGWAPGAAPAGAP